MKAHPLLPKRVASTVLTGLTALLGISPILADEYESLFDGKTLEGWKGDARLWSVEDGVITGATTADNPTEGNTFLVLENREVADFDLQFEYRFILADPKKPSGNSGVQYRSFRLKNAKDNFRIGGYQADFEAGTTYSGILYGEAFRGILAQRGQKTVIEESGKPRVVEQFSKGEDLQKHVKANGEWNSYQVTAKGFHFVHKINGHRMSECTDEDTDTRRSSGLLALQLHAGPPMKVQFRKIRIKHLKTSDTSKKAADTKPKK